MKFLEKVHLYSLLECISSAVDMVSYEITNHQIQVAYLAYRLAERMGWPEDELSEVLIAGMLHDIGALSIQEKLSLIESEDEMVHLHSFRGAKQLGGHPLMNGKAEIIRYHHLPWNNGEGISYRGNSVPRGSHLLHLADRICARVRKNEPVLHQIPGIMAYIRENTGTAFCPEFVDAALEIQRVEHIWLEMIEKDPLDHIPRSVINRFSELDLDDMLVLSTIFSKLIDFRSRFTATHSSGVAYTAERLAELFGFSEKECKMMRIAGNLHDIGKLAIDNSLLEKPGALSENEFNAIRTHTFYTFEILKKIEGFETINKWASYHHERLDGNGYPFHLKGEDIPLGSRIMAVADVFTALTEPRPYRDGMERSKVKGILRKMADSGALSPEVVAVAEKNGGELSAGCLTAQKKAAEEFAAFYREGTE